MKIIYESNTGHTQAYANMLAKNLNIQAISIKDYKVKKEEQEPILFLGWVLANQIQGYSKIKDNFPIIGIVAVGMNSPSQENSKLLIETNQIQKPFFYLQGGIDFNKLKGIKKLLLKLVAKAIKKENKPENEEIIQVMETGGNFVKEENLKEILEYLTNQT